MSTHYIDYITQKNLTNTDLLSELCELSRLCDNFQQQCSNETKEQTEIAIQGLLISIATALSTNVISSHNKELSHAYFTFREAGRVQQAEEETEGRCTQKS